MHKEPARSDGKNASHHLFNVMSEHCMKRLSKSLRSSFLGRRKRGGGVRPLSRNQRGRPHKLGHFSIFLTRIKILHLPNLLQIKWPKSRKKLGFGDRWVWVPNESVTSSLPSPIKPRGDALASWTSAGGNASVADVSDIWWLAI